MLRATTFSHGDHILYTASTCSVLAVLLTRFCWSSARVPHLRSRKLRRVSDLVAGAFRNASPNVQIGESLRLLAEVKFHEDVHLLSPFAPLRGCRIFVSPHTPVCQSPPRAVSKPNYILPELRVHGGIAVGHKRKRRGIDVNSKPAQNGM